MMARDHWVEVLRCGDLILAGNMVTYGCAIGLGRDVLIKSVWITSKLPTPERESSIIGPCRATQSWLSYSK
jgi:hypothetical protein